MKTTISTLLVAISVSLAAQDLYFPPIASDEWDQISMDDLGWNTAHLATLESFLQSTQTNSFILLKDGKIAIESYFGSHTQDSVWYWASAAKSLTAFEIGLIQEAGEIDINAATSDYLGQGWTTCNEVDESQITIRNQLAMTTGLDYNVNDIDCTDPACLTCLNPSSTEWYYHNAPYTLLGDVIESTSGRSRTVHTFQQLGRTIGLSGIWLEIDYLRVFFSTARSMARFGLLMLSDGVWDGQVIMQDQNYLNDMRTTSQDINPSYGYLWWLNSGPTFRLPGSTIDFPGKLIPEASDAIYMALGKDSQIIIVDPTRDIVIIRMGNDPDPSLVPLQFLRDLWSHIETLTATATSTSESSQSKIEVSPNPTSDYIYIDSKAVKEYKLIDLNGRTVLSGSSDVIDVRDMYGGLYILEVTSESHSSRNQISILR